MSPAAGISVVVPTRNRREALAHTVRTLLDQDYHGEYEVIVVDDGSSPPVTVPEHVRLVRHPESRGTNAARNSGVREARHDVVFFVDDDTDVPPGWLGEAVSGASRHPDAWCLGGRIPLRFEGKAPRLCRYCRNGAEGEGGLDLGEVEGPTTQHVIGANLGLRRWVLDRVGEFDENVPFGWEEIEWQDRVRAAGGSIVYLPRAWLWHRRPAEARSVLSRFRRRWRNAWGYAYYCRSRGASVGPLRPILGRACQGIAHAVHHGCSGGIVEAGGELAMLLGDLRFRNVRAADRRGAGRRLA